MIRIPILAGFLFLLAATFAAAHETKPSIATLKFDGQSRFELTFETNAEAFIAEIGPEHEDTDEAPGAALYDELRKLPPEGLVERFQKLQADWLTGILLEFDGKPANLKITDIKVPEVGDTDLARDSTIIVQGIIPENTSRFVWGYPEENGATVLRIERPGQEMQAQFFAPGDVSQPFDIGAAAPRSWWQTSVDYVVIGFTHILPKGLDHILFVLGLFLLSAQWRPLLAQVTAFTLAHSVTLALGLYGVVNISPAIVEPLIALSIVYVAVENIFTRKLHAWRPLIVFAFGLLHGLGFAGVLAEVGLQPSDFVIGLIAFNVGVELGQLAVILLAFAVVGWFISKPWYRARITIPASLAIALMGMWWTVERTLL